MNFSQVPLRWLSVEAMKDNLYSSKSDVWAFAIVLWEIGTLGKCIILVHEFILFSDVVAKSWKKQKSCFRPEETESWSFFQAAVCQLQLIYLITLITCPVSFRGLLCYCQNRQMRRQYHSRSKYLIRLYKNFLSSLSDESKKKSTRSCFWREDICL